MNDREIHFRIEQRPTMPPIIALAILFVIVGAVVGSAKWASENSTLLFVVFGIPIAATFLYHRAPVELRLKRRVLKVCLSICALAVGAFMLQQYRVEQAKRAEFREKHYDFCQKFRGDISAGKHPRNYDFDFCFSLYNKEQAIEMCRPQVLAKGTHLPMGWLHCYEFVNEIVPLPR